MGHETSLKSPEFADPLSCDVDSLWRQTCGPFIYAMRTYTRCYSFIYANALPSYTLLCITSTTTTDMYLITKQYRIQSTANTFNCMQHESCFNPWCKCILEIIFIAIQELIPIQAYTQLLQCEGRHENTLTTRSLIIWSLKHLNTTNT